jgi:hypothetical protein
MSVQRRISSVLPMSCDVLHDISEQRRIDGAGGGWRDVVLVRLASRQAGVVGYGQLRALGLSRGIGSRPRG